MTLWSWRGKSLSTDPSPSGGRRREGMKWRGAGWRQPRARQHSHPSATSGIDEIDCGGCITELRFVARRGKNEEGGAAHPLPAAKTQKGEKTLLLAVTLARLPPRFATRRFHPPTDSLPRATHVLHSPRGWAAELNGCRNQGGERNEKDSNP